MVVLQFARLKKDLYVLACIKAHAKVKNIYFLIRIILDCGNGIIEGTETCDDGNN